MNTLKILHNYCDSKSKKKLVVFTHDYYYSEIIDFSLTSSFRRIFFLILKGILFYFGLVKSKISLKLVKIDNDILSIRGNIVEKSLVIIKKETVVKIYEDISDFSRVFYKEYYHLLSESGNEDFLLPGLLSLEENGNLFTIVCEKIYFSNSIMPLKDVKRISDSFAISLSNINLPKLIDEEVLNEKAQIIRQIDLLISEKLSAINSLVFCHGDLWRGNLLQDGTNKMYIIDFDNLIKLPLGFDFLYYVLNELALENKDFLLKVLNKEQIVYSKIDEYLDLSSELKNSETNEFLFFALKFRYNLLNNTNYSLYENEIFLLLSEMSSGYSIIKNISRNE